MHESSRRGNTVNRHTGVSPSQTTSLSDAKSGSQAPGSGLRSVCSRKPMPHACGSSLSVRRGSAELFSFLPLLVQPRPGPPPPPWSSACPAWVVFTTGTSGRRRRKTPSGPLQDVEQTSGRKKARTQRSSSVAKRSRACMARGILPDVAVQHESDSRLRSGLSSAAGRAEAGRGRAQHFRGEPILRTDRGIAPRLAAGVGRARRRARASRTWGGRLRG
jgi:hypothetical protein